MKVSASRRLGLLALGLAALGCRAERSRSDPMLAILDRADRVEVFRIEGQLALQPTGRELGGYPIKARGKDRDPEFVARLARAIRAYRQQAVPPKGCVMVPGVAYRVCQGSSQVELIVCFECDMLAARHAGAETVKDLDPRRAEFVRLARQAFPDDVKIQALRERR